MWVCSGNGATLLLSSPHYTSASLTRPSPGWLAVTTTLRHFAIVTYAIPPERLAPHLPSRFVPELVHIDGKTRALVSAVPFLDTEFRSARFWTPGLVMGQTNYRLYAIDTATSARIAWFFATTLDSAFVIVPRVLWGMPWNGGRMRFDCELDAATGRYRKYAMKTEGAWAEAELELEVTHEDAGALDGFDDVEGGLFVVTHPLVGFFRRPDGGVSTYSVWHDRLQLKRAHAKISRFGLFDRLGLVSVVEQATPHSVLVQPEADFTIYLPPRHSSS
jgi:uncharacterized protein YqjF (DUF2071 family)